MAKEAKAMITDTEQPQHQEQHRRGKSPHHISSASSPLDGGHASDPAVSIGVDHQDNDNADRAPGVEFNFEDILSAIIGALIPSNADVVICSVSNTTIPSTTTNSVLSRQQSIGLQPLQSPPSRGSRRRGSRNHRGGRRSLSRNQDDSRTRRPSRSQHRGRESRRHQARGNSRARRGN